MGALAAAYPSGQRIVERAADVSHRFAGDLEVVRALEDHARVHQDAGQGYIVLGHLFVLRLSPVVTGGEPEKPAVDTVAQIATNDAVQAFFEHHAEEGLSGGAIAVQQQAQHWRGRELWLLPKPTVYGVIGSGDSARDSVDDTCVRFPPGGYASGVLATLPQDVVPLLVQLGFAFRIRSTDFVQHGQELIRRQVGRARHETAVGGQKRGGRPASDIVTSVDVRPMIGIDADGRKVGVDEFDDFRVRVGAGVHFMAPVAPHRVDRKQDGRSVSRAESKASRPHCRQATASAGTVAAGSPDMVLNAPVLASNCPIDYARRSAS